MGQQLLREERVGRRVLSGKLTAGLRSDHKPSWYVEHGLRKVEPYIYQYRTSVKVHFRHRSPKSGSSYSALAGTMARSDHSGCLQVREETFRNRGSDTDPPYLTAPTFGKHRAYHDFSYVDAVCLKGPESGVLRK